MVSAMVLTERAHGGPIRCRSTYLWEKHAMDSPVVQAILLVLVAAVMNAAYVLPMKLNKKWQWEHTWFAFSILGVAVVPTIIALLTVPMLWSTYTSVSGGTLVAMAVFGAGWGVSLVFFGLALTRLGL